MADYRQTLLSKNGRVTMQLAKDLLTYDLGDRIQTIESYTKAFESSRGTVQAAFKFLQGVGAIQLESRGHLGTYILGIDYRKLWEITDIGSIMGVMPLPYSKRYEGLATGLFRAFEAANIPFSLAFMRGATKRIDALNLDKYHFAIMSKLTAQMELEKNPSLKIVAVLKEESYVRNHVVIFREKDAKEILPGMRVAIDPSSVDQVMLTKGECEGIPVNFVEVSYNQILHKLERNEIDVAIWNGDEIEEKSFDFNVQPMKNPMGEKGKRDDTAAAIVINKPEIEDIFKRFIDIEMIESIQDQVVKNQMIPVY